MVKIPYNTQELMAMKEDLANRKFRVKLIGTAITIALGAAAIGAFFFVPGAQNVALSSGGHHLFGALMTAGTAITSFITLKEVKKLEMDEQYIQSYMQGKNYWGAGYRQEVAEHGLNLQAPSFHGAPPPGLSPKAPHR